MKRTILFMALIIAIAGGWIWLAHQTSAPVAPQSSGGRTILYYQSPMHPWIRSDKPGKCPICGMNLVPIYADAGTGNAGNGLKLSKESVDAAGVQTATVTSRRITRTVRVAGTVEADGPSLQFRFTVYQRDLSWLSIGQTVELALPSSPGNVWQAVILRAGWPSLRTNQPPSATSISISAEISASPAGGNLDKHRAVLNGAYVEGLVRAQTPELLSIPRNAVLAADEQPLVYVVADGDHFEARKITLGRVGDDFAEVITGLREGELVVTSGNLAIDAEVQITRDANQTP